MGRRVAARDRSVEYFKEWISYDPASGVFTWTKTSGKGNAGAAAGTLTKKGYLQISVRGVLVLAHRLGWFMHYGVWPEHQVDHINGIKTDNRLSNLRDATNAQNHCNRGPQRNNTSGVKGVYWFKPNRQWKAQIVVSGKSIVLGYFNDFEAAVRCRKDAESRYQGDWKHEGPPTIGYGP